MNKLNNELIIKENLKEDKISHKSITDVNSRQLIRSEEGKFDKSEDELRKWKQKKTWELDTTLNLTWYWFLNRITRYDIYQKKGDFFLEATSYWDIRKIINEKEMEIYDCIYNNKLDGKAYRVFEANEKTNQLEMDLLPPSECDCHLREFTFPRVKINPSQKWRFDGIWWHIRNCLKTGKEIEEYSQKVIRNYKGALKEIEREALKEKGIVWNCEEPQLDDYFWNRYIQGVYQIAKNRNLVHHDPYYPDANHDLFWDEVRKLKEKLNKEWFEQKKRNTKIKKVENQSIKKTVSNQKPVIHNSSDTTNKIISTERDNKSNKNKSQKLSLEKKNNSKSNNLISIGLPIAIISVPLLVISVLYVVRRKRLNKLKK
jgi:hypothetical protein